MAIQRIIAGVHVIRGMVNIYILESPDGVVVLDTGLPGSEAKILEAVLELGYSNNDIRHILLSHAHPDHMGSAAALKEATNATVWAHRMDAELMEAGTPVRPGMRPTPGLRSHVITSLLKMSQSLGIGKVVPVKVDRHIEDGDRVPFLPDLSAIHVPGHSAGQLAFHLRKDRGVLFSADACVNQGRIRLPVGVEDIDLTRASLGKLRTLEFEALCVMHGAPILEGGDQKLREAKF